MSDECRFTVKVTQESAGIFTAVDSGVFHIEYSCPDHQNCQPVLCTHAAAVLQARYRAAVRMLASLELVEHAGTWITREEADRISKDGP